MRAAATILAIFIGKMLRGRTNVRAIGEFKDERKRTETDYTATASTDRPNDARLGHRIALKLGRIERQTLLLTARPISRKTLFR